MCVIIGIWLLALGSLVCAESRGPARGTLVIVGGGRMTRAVVDEFIESAGGIDAPFVIVPTALEGEDWGEEYMARSFLVRAGAKDVTVLHTRDPEVANTDEFVDPLLRAKGVWFDGGRQWRLADAYLKTKALDEFHAVLLRGGAIGGSSAGATIQGSYLVRGAPEGNTIMMAPGHEVGFGFVTDCAIDQHVIARKRHNDLAPVIATHPELLGLGIDEATAAVVRGHELKVVGDSKILIHHRDLPPREDCTSYETLETGTVYDLANRKVISRPPPQPPAESPLEPSPVPEK